MNIQNLMREAQKMQSDIKKETTELENSVFDGESALVCVQVNGKKEVLKVTINNKESIEKDDMDILEDMISVAFNDAFKKVDAEKEKRLGKYGQGLSGLM